VVCLLGIGKVWPTLNNKTTTKIPHESFKKNLLSIFMNKFQK
jgi:hypothetical protein